MKPVGHPPKRSHYYRTHRPRPSDNEEPISDRTRLSQRRFVIRQKAIIEQKLKLK